MILRDRPVRREPVLSQGNPTSFAHADDQSRAEDKFQPIFVVGCPRSGTTLLSVILDRHSDVAVPPETHFAADVVPAASADSSYGSGGFEALPVEVVRQLLRQTPLKDLGIEPAIVLKRLRGGRTTPAMLLRCVLEEYASRRNKSRVAEKTPGHELYLDQLLIWFPHARFVWIIRDGRAVVQSQRRMHWVHEPVWQLSLHWRRSAVQALRFEAAHPAKIFRIQYEALLRNPDRALAPLHRFLGIRFEPQQLRPNGPTGVIPTYENGWKIKANQAIDVRRSHAWRAETGRRDLFLMNCLMGRYLSEFGYADASMRHYGLAAVAFCKAVDLALTALFAPRVYQVVCKAYRTVKRLRPMVRQTTHAIRLGILALPVEVCLAAWVVLAAIP